MIQNFICPKKPFSVDLWGLEKILDCYIVLFWIRNRFYTIFDMPCGTCRTAE